MATSVNQKYWYTFFTAFFTNMRILKFTSQLTIAFFTAVNYLNAPLREQNFSLTGSKGHGLWFVIDGFRSVLCVSVFQGSLLVIVIMIDGNENRIFRDRSNYRKIFVNVSYYKLFALSQRTFWSFMWLMLFTSQALHWFLFQLFLTSNHILSIQCSGVSGRQNFFGENKRHSLPFSLFFPYLILLLAFPRLHFCRKSLCKNHEDRKNR